GTIGSGGREVGNAVDTVGRADLRHGVGHDVPRDGRHRIEVETLAVVGIGRLRHRMFRIDSGRDPIRTGCGKYRAPVQIPISSSRAASAPSNGAAVKREAIDSKTYAVRGVARQTLSSEVGLDVYPFAGVDNRQRIIILVDNEGIGNG